MDMRDLIRIARTITLGDAMFVAAMLVGAPLFACAPYFIGAFHIAFGG